MRNCIENDITDIKDLFIDGVFITVEQLRARVGPCPGLVLQHNVLLNAIPQRCREQAEIWVNPDIDLPLVVPKLGDLRISHLETAAIRKCLVLLRHKNPCCVNFWQRKFPGLHIDDDVFETVFQVTNTPFTQGLRPLCLPCATTKLSRSPLKAEGRQNGCLGRSRVVHRTFRHRHGRHGRREVWSMFKTVAQRSPRRSVAHRSLKGGRMKAHTSPWSQNGCTVVGHWSPG